MLPLLVTNGYWSDEDECGMVCIHTANSRYFKWINLDSREWFESRAKWLEFLSSHVSGLIDSLNLRESLDSVVWSVRAAMIFQIIPMPEEIKLVPEWQREQPEYQAMVLEKQSHKLPGIETMVECPVCPDSKTHHGSVWEIVIHLNDQFKYPRDDIADWLDDLYKEGVDLAFKDE